MNIFETILVGWGFIGFIIMMEIICDNKFNSINDKQILFLVIVLGPAVWVITLAILIVGWIIDFWNYLGRK
jgi:hypothetical protein